MKKILVLVVALVFGMTAVASAQSKEYKKTQAKNEKVAKDLAKKKVKEFKKGKWESSGATDLETTLITYYLETEPTCGGEKRGIEHTVSDAKTISMAEKRLLLDAQSSYAQEVRTMLAQTLTGQDSATGSDELNTYIGSVAAKSQNEFNGDVKRSFLIYRTNPDGKTLTVRAFYVIDEANGLARVKSLANQAKQNAEIQKIIEKAAGGK
ncbi:MAG: hypothetical protein HDR48_00820 [Bacteroides sp.]|nr:hypothetical protein [Bacteroides sp.]